MSLSHGECVQQLLEVNELVERSAELRERRQPYGWRDEEARLLREAIAKLSEVVRELVD